MDLGVQSVLPGELAWYAELRVLGNGVVPPQAAAATGQFVADFASLTSEGVA